MDAVVWKKATVMALAALVPLTAAACDDGATGVDEGPYTLTFTADASFVAPHAGQALELALVSSDGEVLDTRTGTVADAGDLAFSFTFADALDRGGTYAVHYWVDSNFGGGTAGACDPKAIDHQWNESVGPVTADLQVTVDHDAANTAEVCATFD